MRVFIVIMFIPLIVSGCMAWSWDVVEEKKVSYVGQPVERVIMIFGAPSASGKLDGQEFFTWTNSKTHVSSTPVYNNAYSSGSFNTSSGGFGSYSGSTGYTSYSTRSMQLDCTFTVMAKKGVITDMNVNGNNGACMAYSNRL